MTAPIEDDNRTAATQGAPAHTRLPARFWILWSAYLLNRLALTTPAFLSLYLATQKLANGPQIALVISLSGLGQVLAGLAGGVLTDALGARRTITITQIASAAASLTLWGARSPLLIAALVLATGVLTGLPRSAAYTIAGELAGRQRRVRAFGYLYWANNIGSSLSSITAGALLQFYPPGLFLLAAGGATCYATLSRLFPKVAPRPHDAATGLIRRTWDDLRHPFSQPTMAAFLVLTFLLSSIYMQKQGAFPLDMNAHGLAPTQFGAVLSLNALIIIVLQPLASPLLARLPRTAVFIWASLLMGAGFGANAVVHSELGYALLIAIWSVAEVMLIPTSAAYMSDHAPDGRTGSYQGAYSFAWNCGLAIGSPAGQMLYASAGATTLWTCTIALGTAAAAGHWLLGGLGPRPGS